MTREYLVDGPVPEGKAITVGQQIAATQVHIQIALAFRAPGTEVHPNHFQINARCGRPSCRTLGALLILGVNLHASCLLEPTVGRCVSGDPLSSDSKCRLYTLPLSTHSSEARVPRAPAIASRSCEAEQSTLGKTSRGEAGSRRPVFCRSRSTFFWGRYRPNSPPTCVRGGSFVKTITAQPPTFFLS